MGENADPRSEWLAARSLAYASGYDYTAQTQRAGIKERKRGIALIEYCVEESLAAHWRAACVSTRVLVV